MNIGHLNGCGFRILLRICLHLFLSVFHQRYAFLGSLDHIPFYLFIIHTHTKKRMHSDFTILWTLIVDLCVNIYRSYMVSAILLHHRRHLQNPRLLLAVYRCQRMHQTEIVRYVSGECFVYFHLSDEYLNIENYLSHCLHCWCTHQHALDIEIIQICILQKVHRLYNSIAVSMICWMKLLAVDSFSLSFSFVSIKL